LGVQLAHGNQDAAPDVATGAASRGEASMALRVMLDEALRGPLVVSIIRDIVGQWLATKAVTLAPTDEQVAKVLATDEGTEAIAKALRVQGYAGIYSAMHRNHSEVVRRALHTPSEVADGRSDPATIGMRFAYIMGDHDGAAIMNGFFAALGSNGRKVFGDAVRKIVAAERAAESTDGIQN
jgi:hypothetical protein